jgi:hypothetical protein
MYIIGAGFTGLIAGVFFPQATILESRAGPFENHQALLRFRTPNIGDLTHIPFEPVQVLKSIWYQGSEVSPSPRFTNMYSRKVTGQYHGRSISNIDSVERYIAPQDFYYQLLELVGDRIVWDFRVQAITKDYISSAAMSGDVALEEGTVIDRTTQPIVATIPLGNTVSACSLGARMDYKWLPISTYRGELKPCSKSFGTVYYPDPKMCTYRASTTGKLLIVETVETVDGEFMFDESLVILESLGLDPDDVDFKFQKPHTQKYGKIAPIDNNLRKSLVYNLTNKFNVYSVGRFGTWRNILLDDVYSDLKRIRELIRMGTYERSMHQI